MTVHGFEWVPTVRLPERAFGWWVMIVGVGAEMGGGEALGMSHLATVPTHLPGGEGGCVWGANCSHPTQVFSL